MPLTYITIACFLAYFITISYLASLKPIYIPARKLYLFRCLFPSWKFYEDIGHLPVLYYRLGNSKDLNSFEPWTLAIKKLERNWKYLFLNPEGNLVHAYNSLLQQLENDKEDISEDKKDELINSTSYQLTKNLVVKKILEQENQKQFFQFKLTSTMQGAPDEVQDILISAVHEVIKE